jgi:hypothetical protein
MASKERTALDHNMEVQLTEESEEDKVSVEQILARFNVGNSKCVKS